MLTGCPGDRRAFGGKLLPLILAFLLGALLGFLVGIQIGGLK